jgi:hypothetical protein
MIGVLAINQLLMQVTLTTPTYVYGVTGVCLWIGGEDKE